MAAAEIEAFVRARVEQAYRVIDRELHQAVSAMIGEMISRGVLQSSMTLKRESGGCPVRC
jgi:hypothetical protein